VSSLPPLFSSLSSLFFSVAPPHPVLLLSLSPSLHRLNRKYIRAEFTCNEWTGIILVCAFVPIVLLYIIWILATIMGAIKAPAHYPDAQACLKPLSRAQPTSQARPSSSLPFTQSAPLENEWLEANKPARFAPV